MFFFIKPGARVSIMFQIVFNAYDHPEHNDVMLNHNFVW